MNAKDFGRNDKHAEFKHYVIVEKSDKLVIPNGTKNKWNLREEILPKLSILRERDDVVELMLPYFGNNRGDNSMIGRAVPVKKIKTSRGVKFVTTVYDLTLANYGIDTGIGGECANSYDDDTPYTPRRQEKFTGVNADMVIHTARKFADNALKTHERIMVTAESRYHTDMIYRTILNLLMMCGAKVVKAMVSKAAQNFRTQHSFSISQRINGAMKILTRFRLSRPPKRYRHPGDYNILATRLGWLLAYPSFKKSGQKIFDKAKAAGFDAGLDVKNLLRSDIHDDELAAKIHETIYHKPREHFFGDATKFQMYQVGG